LNRTPLSRVPEDEVTERQRGKREQGGERPRRAGMAEHHHERQQRGAAEPVAVSQSDEGGADQVVEIVVQLYQSFHAGASSGGGTDDMDGTLDRP